MTVKTETLSIQGVEVPVTRQGSGKPLFLLHGGGGPVSALPFAAKLAEQFEIIEPTHPGFNGTAVPDHFDGMPDLVFAYLDIIDALKLEDAVILGISMGGWLAAELCVLPQMPFSKLIMVDAVGVRTGPPTKRNIADIFALPGPELAKAMWHDPTRAPNPMDMTDEQATIAAGNRIALALYGWEPFLHNPKLPNRLHRIRIPTRFIWGESDGLVTVEYGKTYADMIDGADFVTIPEAGHSPQAEQPELFVKHVVDFAG